MKNAELFDKTIGILVNAYFNDTLVHSCNACAVGNMICYYNGYDPKTNWRYRWNEAFVTVRDGNQKIYQHNYIGEAKRQIDSTGYDFYELAAIEKAFETGDSDRKNVYDGLISVCDTLMQIHEANETEITEAKALFFKTSNS